MRIGDWDADFALNLLRRGQQAVHLEPKAMQVLLARRKAARGWDLLRHEGPGQIQFWFIALGVGIAAGFAAMSR